MSHHFLAKTATFQEIFPQIMNIRIEYTESEAIYEKSFASQNPVVLSGVDGFPSVLPCCVSNCVDGGVDIRAVVENMIRSNETEKINIECLCRGRLRKKGGDECQNHFKYTIFISYKDKT